MSQIDMFKRNDQGVKIRSDGNGDQWANQHRDELGSKFYIQDVDGLFGMCSFAQNSGERLFMEYVPDHYRNKSKIIREFAVIAIFDRKQSKHAIQVSDLSTAFYLHQARLYGRVQPIMPKFFFVVGTESPWTLIELNITTGETISECVLDDGEWLSVWKTLKLTDMRDLLRAWAEKQ